MKNKNFFLIDAEMKVSQASHPPETRLVSVRPEEETMIAGSRGRASIDFHLLLVWCARTLAAKEF